jgi:putative transposase
MTSQRRLHQQIRQAADAGAAVNGLCQAAGVSRAGYYRCLARPQPQAAAMDLRSQIQRVALRWPAYGYRRVHAELLRHGWTVNHKRILRLMRADNLLCLPGTPGRRRLLQ